MLTRTDVQYSINPLHGHKININVRVVVHVVESSGGHLCVYFIYGSTCFPGTWLSLLGFDLRYVNITCFCVKTLLEIITSSCRRQKQIRQREWRKIVIRTVHLGVPTRTLGPTLSLTKFPPFRVSSPTRLTLGRDFYWEWRRHL